MLRLQTPNCSCSCSNTLHNHKELKGGRNKVIMKIRTDAFACTLEIPLLEKPGLHVLVHFSDFLYDVQLKFPYYQNHPVKSCLVAYSLSISWPNVRAGRPALLSFTPWYVFSDNWQMFMVK